MFCNISEMRQRGRFAGFSLYISKSGDTEKLDDSILCYKDGPELPPLNITKTCIKSGRYVIIYNERLKGVPYPAGYESAIVVTELCEVFVYGNQTIINRKKGMGGQGIVFGFGMNKSKQCILLSTRVFLIQE